MPILTGITHAIVRTCTEEDYKVSSVLAYVDLCFTKDEDCIRAIPFKRLKTNTFAFQSPNTMVFKNGNKELTTPFSGALDEEICTKASKAMSLVKELGGFKFNKTYRVTKAGAKEI